METMNKGHETCVEGKQPYFCPPRHIDDDSDLSPNEVLLLAVVSDTAGSWEETCWKSEEELAKITGWTTRTIRTHRRSLIEKGRIEKVGNALKVLPYTVFVVMPFDSRFFRHQPLRLKKVSPDLLSGSDQSHYKPPPVIECPSKFPPPSARQDASPPSWGSRHKLDLGASFQTHPLRVSSLAPQVGVLAQCWAVCRNNPRREQRRRPEEKNCTRVLR